MVIKTILIITILTVGKPPLQVVGETANMDVCIYKAEEFMKAPLEDNELAKSATCGIVRTNERES